MAAQNARQRHPAPGPKSETVDRFVRIFGTAGKVPATRPEKRRQRHAINRDQSAPRETGQVGKACKRARVSHGRCEVIVENEDGAAPTKFHRNGTKDCLDSDFFTLDRNLAPALRITYAGGTSAAQAQPERAVSHARRRAKAARQ